MEKTIGIIGGIAFILFLLWFAMGGVLEDKNDSEVEYNYQSSDLDLGSGPSFPYP